MERQLQVGYNAGWSSYWKCWAEVIGFAEGVNVIFVGRNVGTFIINLKLQLAKKVSSTHGKQSHHTLHQL
jgi:hypothetical protein